MTRYWTGRGDRGKSFMGSKKIAKDDPLFHALGSLDELNVWTGYCRAACSAKFRKLCKDLRRIQEFLFIAQAEIGALGMDQAPRICVTEMITLELEKLIKEFNEKTPELTKFIVPSGSELALRLEIARTVARRAERACLTYSQKSGVSNDLLQFLNRLSSLFFAASRFVNHKFKIKEENPRYK